MFYYWLRISVSSADFEECTTAIFTDMLACTVAISFIM
ncbi:hypothetical protein BSIN_3158 [Burkholderia singularis]|uniref:Uncharacterized protein n=1 Tax=Burkholderia singularis TaxID=1503053 RepID=A0A238H3W5_9BURK|nr:hypothetical protein BSIN_3158 [Burkholderia singularis]